jgi:hypothetical protein
MMGLVLLNPSYSWPYGTAKNVGSDFNFWRIPLQICCRYRKEAINDTASDCN